MAELIIRTKKIQENIKTLSAYFREHDIYWSLITKVFSGDKEFLSRVLTDDVIREINSIGDSRLTSLKNLKAVNPDMRTIYIKPPARIYADEVVEFADISLNSSFATLEALNEAAQKQDKIHRVVIMVEMGELREGINFDDIVDFYERVFDFSNIQVIGLGSNLGCMFGIAPTREKLLELVHLRELISDKFGKNLPLISAGTSITLPMVESGEIPPEINHFRIGEAAFFGISPLDNKPFANLHTDTFSFKANIIELEEKKLVPEGEISDASIGHTADLDLEARTDLSYKAILDFGMLDVDHVDLTSQDEDIKFVGITSDMLVVDLGDNKDAKRNQIFKSGDTIEFKTNYMAVARLLNSKFIDRVYL
jgi:predicted amino acid racemase